MESEDEDVYNSHDKLMNFIASSPSNKSAGIIEYLKWVKFPPVSDFKKGLDWFNVSEPLSFDTHLKGKIVLLDFFTYCCINCMHILPDLKEIENEFSIEDGLVVVGVHSAKFSNEKESNNILSAVQRYNIAHPVVNDNQSEMWDKCDVHCWPTLLLMGPNANPLIMLMGEGHKEKLRLYIRNTLDYYKSNNMISNHTIPMKSAFHLLPELKGPLLFPGKITNFDGMIAVSDTGNNRVLIIKDENVVIQIGSGKCGFKDGTFEEAEFNQCQGLAFQNNNILFIADTENHAIRKVYLDTCTVETVAGNGKQGNDQTGGKKGQEQAISSPWDLCIYKTNSNNLNEEPSKEIVIIAMAGTHQIWALFLNDIVWWKSKSYSAGMVVCIAGNGKEENRNNQYPNNSAFAQPSGLAISHKNKEVYIADSESSSVRKLSLINGKVSAVVGGDINPNNLFAYGDKDGKLYEAKLQHSLGLALSSDENTLFVADTYNHKIKKIDLSKNSITTLQLPVDNKLSTFKEPAGLCFINNQIYLADTNNHLIKIIHLNNELNIEDIKQFTLTMRQSESKNKYTSMVTNKQVKISDQGGRVVMEIKVIFKKGYKMDSESPNKWTVTLPTTTWSATPSTGNDFNNIYIVVTIPETAESTSFFEFVVSVVKCEKTACVPKTYTIKQPVIFERKAPTSVFEKVTLRVDNDIARL